MAEITYVTVTWTAGDVITEAKLDNMVANDRAVDAMAQGIEFAERADPSTPGASKLHLYAKDKDGVPTLYTINDAGTVAELRASRPTFFFTSIGGVVTGSEQFAALPSPYPLTIVKAFAYVKTAPTGANIIVDLNKNGTSIWASTQANRLTIAAGTQSGNQTSFDTTTLAEDDILLPEVDQVGSTVPGTALTIYLRCR